MSAVPVFSVIIPSHGRSGPLSACLRALRASVFPDGQFEIVVVDDASPTRLAPAVAGDAVGDGIRWVRLPDNAGPAAARNEGARVARGTYLAFIDDDCVAARGWLAELKRVLDAHPGAAVGGQIVDGSDGNLYCRADQTILDVAYAYYNPAPHRAQFLATGNLAVPADGFRQIGGFDAAYRTSEDRDFCARWLASRRQIVYAPDALVVHAATSSFRRFCARHFAFGEGSYRFRSRHVREQDGSIRLEPGRFYRQLMLAPFVHGLSTKTVALSCLVVLSQAASACGFVAAQISNGRTA